MLDKISKNMNNIKKWKNIKDLYKQIVKCPKWWYPILFLSWLVWIILWFTVLFFLPWTTIIFLYFWLKIVYFIEKLLVN